MAPRHKRKQNDTSCESADGDYKGPDTSRNAAPTTTQFATGTLTVPHGLTKYLEVRNIPGKGNGLVTLQTIKRGQLLFADEPLIHNLCHKKWKHDIPKVEERAKRQLQTTSEQLALSYLTKVHGDLTKVGDTIYSRIIANGFMSCGRETRFNVYPRVSYINHSCRPNCSNLVIDDYTGVMEIRAWNTLPPGTEITIDYIPDQGYCKGDDRPLQSIGKRQQEIQDHWGFLCSCEACIDTSCDRRRTMINKFLAGQKNYDTYLFHTDYQTRGKPKTQPLKGDTEEAKWAFYYIRQVDEELRKEHLYFKLRHLYAGLQKELKDKAADDPSWDVHVKYVNEKLKDLVEMMPTEADDAFLDSLTVEKKNTATEREKRFKNREAKRQKFG